MMQYSQKGLIVVACLLSLRGLGGSSLAQQARQPVTTAPVRVVASTQTGKTPDEAKTFPARITQGPTLSLRTVDPDNVGVKRTIQGPVWDGTNKGFWIVVEGLCAEGTDDALLIDPATGRERRQLAVPVGGLLGHDGVGLWFDTLQGCRRTRTAPDLSSEQEQARDLPQDLQPLVFRGNLRSAPSTPSVSVCSFFTNRLDLGNASPIRPLQRLDLDLQTISAYGHIGFEGMTQGAGYLWLVPSCLSPQGQSFARLPLHSLRPMESSDPKTILRQLPDLSRQIQTANVEGEAVPLARHLAWDGQHLWTLSADILIPQHDRSMGNRGNRGENHNGKNDRHSATPATRPTSPPPHLVMIDVGLTRKPDTDARYKKALAFEKANGTLKALPLFEQIFTDDPSAVDVRNHVAWALAARPQEPYHNLDRALELVNEALQWQPWNPEMWDTLAEIYWRKGDAKLAVHLEAKAINLNPHKSFYWRQYEKFQAGPTAQEAPEPTY